MEKKAPKKILVAINGSEGSIRAAMKAIMICREYSLELKFVYVIDTATISYLGMNQMLAKDEQTDYKVDLAYEGQNYLEYAAGLAASKGVTAATELRDGAVVTQILDVAEKFKANVIVIGSTRKKHTDRFVKRNVHSTHESDIMENSKIPVLVIPALEEIEEQFKLF